MKSVSERRKHFFILNLLDPFCRDRIYTKLSAHPCAGNTGDAVAVSYSVRAKQNGLLIAIGKHHAAVERGGDGLMRRPSFAQTSIRQYKIGICPERSMLCCLSDDLSKF